MARGPLTTRPPEDTGRRPTGEASDAYAAFISYSHAADGKLAPALQGGLHDFARPWFRLRALRVFRDEASLSANPGLWSSIEQALASSEFYILLASPEAARSTWVGREVGYWLGHKSLATVLIVLTDGELAWDDAVGDFDWSRTALPPSLRGAFPEEPRYIDLRWARAEKDVSLHNPRFRNAVADIAAPLHHRSKDELIGEDVRQHRRTKLLTRSVVTVLTAFVALVSVLAVAAWQARNRAEQEQQVATSRFLSAAAINSLDRHFDRAALLSVEASAIEDTAESRNALLTTVQRTPDAQRFLRSEGAEVADVALSPDGTVAAAVDHDGLVAVWNVRSGRELVPPAVAHDGQALAVAFSPDGRFLATGGGDGSLAVWDAASLALERRLQVTDPAVRSVAFSPDGRWLAAGGGAPTSHESISDWADRVPRRIEVFDPSTWAHLGALTGHVGAVENIRFSADSSRIYSASIDFDSGVVWWETGTWAGQWVGFPEQLGTNEGMGVSPDGNQVAVGSNLSDAVLVWDVRENRAVARLTGLVGFISGLDYSPEGDLIAASTLDGQIGVWATGGLDRPVRRLAGHDRNIEGGGTKVAFGPGGLLVSGSSGGAVVFHDLNVTTRLVTDVLAGRIDVASGEVVGNDRGAVAFGASRSPAVELWDTRTGELRSIPLPTGARLGTGSALSPDGRRVAVVVGEGDQLSLALLDTRTGRVLWQVDGDVIGAAFAPDGATIALAEASGEVGLLDVATGTRRATLPAQPPVPEELERYAELDIVLQPEETVLAFADDGSVLAVAGPDGPVWLWDVEERRLALAEPLLGHGRVSSMVFSPGGDVLATGGDDERIRLWDVATGDLTGLTSERPQGRVYDLLFSPDGRTLVSSSPEHELWDVETRQRIGEPIEVTDPLSTMAFEADGGALVVAGPRGDVRRVDTSVDHWIDIACTIANRDLSAEETQQYLNGRDAHTCSG